jgi:hypothetical protein
MLMLLMKLLRLALIDADVVVSATTALFCLLLLM